MVDWNKLAEQVNAQVNAASNSASEWSRDWLNAELPLGALGGALGGQPSTRKYAECKEASGESGWDENGMWKCLFPGSKRPTTFYTDYKQFLEDRHIRYKREQALLEQQAQKKYSLISESEAKDKVVTGRSVNIESCTDETGKEISRKRVVTYYSDNTASVEMKEGSGSWFWKNE